MPTGLIEANEGQGRPRPFSAQAVLGPCFSTGRMGQQSLAPTTLPAASGGGKGGGGRLDVADVPP